MPPRYYLQRGTGPEVASVLPLLPAGKWVGDRPRRERVAVCRMIPADTPLRRTLRHLPDSRLYLPAKLGPALTTTGGRLLLRVIPTCSITLRISFRHVASFRFCSCRLWRTSHAI